MEYTTVQATTDSEGVVLGLDDAMLALIGHDEISSAQGLDFSSFPTVLNDLQAQRYFARTTEAKRTQSLIRDTQLRNHPITALPCRADSTWHLEGKAIVHECVIYDVAKLFHGFLSNIDYTGRLHVSDTLSLSAMEISVLHHTLAGESALEVSNIVNRSHHSVKSCLKRVKSRLQDHGNHNLPTTKALHKLGLLSFILATPDWGSLEDTYRTL